MNKFFENKKLLGFTVFIVIIFFAGGLWGFNTFFASNPVVEKELFEQFGEDFFFDFDIDFDFDLELAIPEEVNGNGDMDEDTKSQDSETENGQKLQEGSTGDSNDSRPPVSQDELPKDDNSKTKEPPPVTEDSVVAKYRPRFKGLEVAALDRLETLYAAGIEEYKKKKEDGTLNTAKLASKYLQAARTLESGVDAVFFDFLGQLRQELEKNNLPTNIIREIENDYQSNKSARRSEFIGRLNL